MIELCCYIFTLSKGFNLRSCFVDYQTIISGISTSSLGDQVFVLHTPSENKQKGDAIVESTFAIEAVTKIAKIAKKNGEVKVIENGR